MAIVGAGFTGLWTAYYLATSDPSLRIAVLEAEIAGYGASGRNGGWCSALFPKSIGSLAEDARPGSGDRHAPRHAGRRSTRSAGSRPSKASTATTSRAAPSCWPAPSRSWTGPGPRPPSPRSSAWDSSLLSAEEAQARLNATRVVGGTYTPDCARDPAGEAGAWPGRGGAASRRADLREDARDGAGAALAGDADGSLGRRHRQTPHGTVKARFVVRATEGYTTRLPGLKRAIAPVYSLMVATPPLPTSFWDEVGLADRETFSDFRHLIIYGQRTADDRLAFGGRGAPYHFGSQISTQVRPGRAASSTSCAGCWPICSQRSATCRSTSPGAARWACPATGTPPSAWTGRTGLAWAGGYVGDGVSTTNLAGRTLADLILSRDTELTALPWVNHRSPNWEPEPLRWLGVNAGLWAMSGADPEESPDRPAVPPGRLVQPVSGALTAGRSGSGPGSRRGMTVEIVAAMTDEHSQESAPRSPQHGSTAPGAAAGSSR